MFKKDDIVVCLPDFVLGDTDSKGKLKGGYGWVNGNIYSIRENYGNISHFNNATTGCHNQALRLATPLEIIAFNSGITNINLIKEKYYEIY